MEIEKIARICHEVNRVYCSSIGDCSQVPWDEAADWQKESAVNGVQSFIDDPTQTPAMSHKNWLEHKGKCGWCWGETKDETKKTHPCFVPYDELPENQKVKDLLFTEIIKAAISDTD